MQHPYICNSQKKIKNRGKCNNEIKHELSKPLIDGETEFNIR